MGFVWELGPIKVAIASPHAITSRHPLTRVEAKVDRKLLSLTAAYMLLLRIIDSHRQDSSCEAAQCCILQMKAYDDAMSSKTYRRSPLESG